MRDNVADYLPQKVRAQSDRPMQEQQQQQHRRAYSEVFSKLHTLKWVP